MGNTESQEKRDENLSVAAEKGEAERVDQLLKRGADPNRRLLDGERRQRTSLHRAAKTKNNVDVLTKLLTYVKDVDTTDDDGNTALHLAAGYYNNAAVVQTLLHANPNCRIQNSKGQTALHSAVENGSDWKVVELLLKADSDPNIPDFDGNTPLHLCSARTGAEELIPGILLRFGSNPNIKNAQGQTPLHLAAKAGNKVVLLLLKFHAKVRLKDKEGRKPSDVTDSEDIKRILEYEEKSLEERTVRTDYAPPFMTSPSTRYSHTSTYNGYNLANGSPAVIPNGNRTHFWASDRDEWKGYGGEAVFHLPDKSDIVVPPEAMPHGTTLKLTIKPSKTNDEESLPVFDFHLYDFEIDIKLSLPGSMQMSPSKEESRFLSDESPSSVPQPAFTGFCADGKNRWKSCREMAWRSNGTVGLHFNLMRYKSESLSYKVPSPNRRSTTEMLMMPPNPKTMPRSTNHTVDADDLCGSRKSSLVSESENDLSSTSLSTEEESYAVYAQEQDRDLLIEDTPPHNSDVRLSNKLSKIDDASLSPRSESDNDLSSSEEIEDTEMTKRIYIGDDLRDYSIHSGFSNKEELATVDVGAIPAVPNGSIKKVQYNQEEIEQAVLENPAAGSSVAELTETESADKKKMIEDFGGYLESTISSSSSSDDDENTENGRDLGLYEERSRDQQERLENLEDYISKDFAGDVNQRYEHPIDPALATIEEEPKFLQRRMPTNVDNHSSSSSDDDFR